MLRERLGAVVQVTYSSNETNTVCFVDNGNVGTLIDGAEVRIVDHAGETLTQGQTGLVQVKTQTMAKAYWNDPARTAAAFVDGWYRTSDTGYIPEPGKLVVLGRADDMLNIGGVKVPPAPLEDAVKAIPGVIDAVLLNVD